MDIKEKILLIAVALYACAMVAILCGMWFYYGIVLTGLSTLFVIAYFILDVIDMVRGR